MPETTTITEEANETTSRPTQEPVYRRPLVPPRYYPFYGAVAGGIIGHRYGNAVRGVGAGGLLGAAAYYVQGVSAYNTGRALQPQFLLPLGTGVLGAYIGNKYDSPVIGGVIGFALPIAVFLKAISGIRY